MDMTSRKASSRTWFCHQVHGVLEGMTDVGLAVEPGDDSG